MIAAAQPRATLPWFGTRRDQLEALATGVGALLVTATYVLVARSFDTPTTAVEAVSLWASLACVWLARVENIWCMPYGLASVLLLGWWAWSRGGTGRTELPVTRLVARSWLGVLAEFVALWAAVWVVFDQLYIEVTGTPEQRADQVLAALERYESDHPRWVHSG